MKTCCVLGLGYIGLPTAAVLSRAGYKVFGVDINEKIVDTINQGDIHIVEPDLLGLVKDMVINRNFSAHLKPRFADIFLIAVPTPLTKGKDQSLPTPNIDFVLSAVKNISKYIRRGNLVIIESTSPVGTTEAISKILQDETGFSSSELHIAYCPERVLPGRILKELIHNDRIVGGLTSDASNRAKSFYQSFCLGDIHITNSRTAELAKLSENSFRDINIAFANELSCVCDELNINTRELIKLTNHHPRVEILNPGCGVGGHCIAVDPWFIVSSTPSLTPLIKTARQVNNNKKQWVVDKILLEVIDFKKTFGITPVIGCFGITFKPDIDDLRESPALDIVRKLIEKQEQVLVCDPNLSIHNEFQLHSIDHTVKNANILVFLVAHSVFRGIDVTARKIIDVCGVID